MQNELLELSEQAVAVVHHAVEAQHFSIHFEKLTQFVEVGRRLRHLDGEAFHAFGGVRVGGTVFRRVQFDTFTLQPVLNITSASQCVTLPVTTDQLKRSRANIIIRQSS